MSNQLKIQPKIRFWIKVCLLLLPFCSIVAVYFIFDPFMVLHRYKRFDSSQVMLNEAYVGWQNYMLNRDSIAYNSYIMGNSWTMAFKSKEWEKYLKKGDRAVRFFDTGESLGGVSQKLQALDSAGARINNVLVVVSRTLLKDIYPIQENGHLFSAEVANLSQMEFQLRFLQKFLDPSFTIPYLDYLIRGKYTSYMYGVINPGPPIREPYTNNFINPREREIVRAGNRYWILHKSEFKQRTEAGNEDERLIFEEQMKLLRKIKSVCDKHGANLKFIVGPDYSQKRINRVDLALLKNLFGNSVVCDFSGINSYTSDIHNYYEPGHFRPIVGARMLEQIYSAKR